jgi:hypothetical protein
LVEPSRGMPNICNLYHKASISSTAILIATNSEPKVEVSTVFFALENQIMGAQFKNIRIPV